MRLFIYFIVLIICAAQLPLLHAAKVDTVTTTSVVMQKNIKAVVVTPDSYSKSEALPVVYLLHGYGDSYADGWIKKGKGFEQLA
ncbi:MAG: esterase family protein, partial [Bacteroidales bacterium]|nr:esterase family protein [Bacteroidales bacterium]